MNVRLVGTFQTLSPLSHIGEAISTTTYLSEEPVVLDDGSVALVFSYSGNAWRGQLRDLCASYMLDNLGGLAVPLDSFHLLFSGGRIGGEQVVDVARARAWRRAIPMFALFGGGVVNQILPGKLRVNNSYPVCREAIPLLPLRFHDQAALVSYRQLTFEKSFSRKDDAKDDRVNHYIALPPGQKALTDGTEKVRDREGPADQMRMTSELLAPGVTLYTTIDALDVSEVELGCLVSGLHRFSRSPYIGGQANRGHGHVRLEYELLDLDTGETRPFVSIGEGPALLAPPAKRAKDAYDQHLRVQYDALLAAQQPEMVAMLGAGRR